MMEPSTDLISERIRMAVEQEEESTEDEDAGFQVVGTTTLAASAVVDCDVVNNIVRSTEPGISSLEHSEGTLLQHASPAVEGVPIVAGNEEIATPSQAPSISAAMPLLDGSDNVVGVNATVQPDSDMSPKERMRRERVRQRKMAQRESAAFRERERLKAKERMKILRNDPVYRFHERQRDRERRKQARLNNQAQRAREREKDRLRKSLARSSSSGAASKEKEKMHLQGFQLLLGVSDSEEADGGNEGLVWQNESPS